MQQLPHGRSAAYTPSSVLFVGKRWDLNALKHPLKETERLPAVLIQVDILCNGNFAFWTVLLPVTLAVCSSGEPLSCRFTGSSQSHTAQRDFSRTNALFLAGKIVDFSYLPDS